MSEKCKLCLKEPVELRKSHFLPKAIYRILREEGQANPNPVMLTDRAAIQTSEQMTAYLLCNECEQRFSKNGERWVLGHCLRQNGQFRLGDELHKRVPDIYKAGDDTKLYFAGTIPEIDVAALTYFAISVFWRGAIYPWNSDGSYPVPLGPYQESFRRYLMGQEGFPDDAVLWVLHRQAKEASRLTYTPVGSRNAGFHVHRFPMPGLAFLLMVGNRIPNNMRERCFWRAPEHPIISTPILERILTSEAVDKRRNSLRRQAGK